MSAPDQRPELPDTLYERVGTIGWRLSAEDRHRCDQLEAQRLSHTGLYARSRFAGMRIQPVDELVTMIGYWCDLNRTLEHDLRTAYEHDPRRITLLVESIVHQAAARMLRSPGGLLRTRLNELCLDAPLH